MTACPLVLMTRLFAGLKGLQVPVPEPGWRLFPDYLLQEVVPAKKLTFPRGESQDYEIDGHWGEPKARRHPQGIQRKVVPRGGAVDHQGASRLHVMPMHGDILFMEKESQVRGPGRDQGAPGNFPP